MRGPKANISWQQGQQCQCSITTTLFWQTRPGNQTFYFSGYMCVVALAIKFCGEKMDPNAYMRLHTFKGGFITESMHNAQG